MSECKPILPNFLLAGAAKSGTTALYYQLKGHPEIHWSPVKEPCFFSAQIIDFPQNGIRDDEKYYARTLGDYYKLFAGAEGKKAIGEASVDTLYFYKKTIPLIKQYLGDPAIILMLRHPIERAFSAYMHLVRDNREFLSFEEGLKQEAERIRQNWQCMWHYQTRGMYYQQVKAFKEAFSRVSVWLYDDFKKAPQATIKQILEFLGVDSTFQPVNTSARYNVTGIPRFKCLNNFFLMKNKMQRSIRNIGSFLLTEDRWVKFREGIRAKFYVKAVMKPGTRAFLLESFREDILKLQDLLDRDLGHWLKLEN